MERVGSATTTLSIREQDPLRASNALKACES
jgi:hypothetical protein